MKLTHEALAGAWIVAGSEIERLQPSSEIYHFTADYYTMEFPPSPWNHRVQRFRYRYEMTEDGFIYGKEKLNIRVTSWIEEGFLIFRPSHGMETWSLREPAPTP